MTISITMLCNYAECLVLFTILLNVVMLSVVMLSVVAPLLVLYTNSSYVLSKLVEAIWQ
jgi:hypothetical protein